MRFQGKKDTETFHLKKEDRESKTTPQKKKIFSV